MPLMCAILSGLFIGGHNGWPPQANKQKSVSLRRVETVLVNLFGGTVSMIREDQYIFS